MSLKEHLNTTLLRKQLNELYGIDDAALAGAAPASFTPATPLTPSGPVAVGTAPRAPGDVPATTSPEHAAVEGDVFQSIVEVLSDFDQMLGQCQGAQYDAIRATSAALSATLTAHLATCNATPAPATTAAPPQTDATGKPVSVTPVVDPNAAPVTESGGKWSKVFDGMKLSYDGMYYDLKAGAVLNRLGIKGLINTKTTQDSSAIMNAITSNMNKLEMAASEPGAPREIHSIYRALDAMSDHLAAHASVE